MTSLPIKPSVCVERVPVSREKLAGTRSVTHQTRFFARVYIIAGLRSYGATGFYVSNMICFFLKDFRALSSVTGVGEQAKSNDQLDRKQRT